MDVDFVVSGATCILFEPERGSIKHHLAEKSFATTRCSLFQKEKDWNFSSNL